MQLRDELQAALEGSYTLDRELGGGGMSRVFVAHDTRLGRPVVVKVLSPELAAGINAERFEREIKLAASLQQANIVPVLSAGDAGGLPFYTMPFVEGESLRTRLAQSPPLGFTDIIRILGDVARALQYAHDRGIVHRDIKPDNVLLSGGTAVVTDFGIAKALSAARTGDMTSATLTQLGMSIGTPAYIAPEQAAGDPGVDHRADIYAFGCMAYELLTGQPPFHGRTPQRMLAAHMAEQPRPLGDSRPDVPPAVATLIMRCLAKDPADRPQSAAEIARALDFASSGGTMAAMPNVLLGGPAAFRKALLVYLVCATGVVVVAKAATIVIGLPTWVFPSAIFVMLLGLPVILFTGYVQSVARRTLLATPAFTPGGGTRAHGTMATLALKASPHVSWKRATRGGIVASGALVAVVLAFMITRAMGVGPAGTLFAKGVMNERDKVLVADFESPAADTSLGSVVAEGVRSTLRQSKAITVVQASQVAAALARMQKPATSQLDFATAREIAQREGYKAVIDGKVTSVAGGSYIITARVIAAESGDELASFREAARDASAIIPTIDKLTADVRGKLGESLKSVAAAPSLARLTTSSLPALRKYMEGFRYNNIEQNYAKAAVANDEAVRLDSTFAMAYRGAAITYTNAGLDPEHAELSREKAFQYRDRLPEFERMLVEGEYYYNGAHADRQRALQAYRRAIELDPRQMSAWTVVGNIYRGMRQYARAESAYKAGLVYDTTYAFLLSNQTLPLLATGRTDEAAKLWDIFRRRFPRNSITSGWNVTAQKFGVDSARAECATASQSENIQQRVSALSCQSSVDMTRGRLLAAEEELHRALAVNSSRGAVNPASKLTYQFTDAFIKAWYLGKKAASLPILDTISAGLPLARLPIGMETTPVAVIQDYALADRPDKARAFYERWIATLDTAQRRLRSSDVHLSLARIEVAEKKYDDAIREFQAADTLYDGLPSGCPACMLPELGITYDLAGKHDDAIATFEQYVALPVALRWLGTDRFYLGGIYKRLGELYDEKNDLTKAAAYYGKFIDLWKNADPALQPRVAEARARLALVQKRDARTR